MEIEKLYQEFRLSEALKQLYSLVWDDFCSWYLEWVKPPFGAAIDAGVYRRTVSFFEELMQLLHPFMPFITEEIYHLLADQSDDLCIKQFSPVGKTDAALLEQGALLKEAITALRDARNKAQIKPKETMTLHIQTEAAAVYRNIQSILSRQVNATEILFTREAIAGTLTVVAGKDKFFIGTEKAIDTGNQKEEMEKELVYLKGFLESVNKKLSNERFVQNAKPEVVEFEQKKKADALEKIKVIEDSLKGL
jgi:valyl-tRNA synthetase